MRTLQTAQLAVSLLVSTAVFSSYILIKLNAPLGVDISVYKEAIDNGISEWSIYYLRESLSWRIIETLGILPFSNLNIRLIVLDFSVILLIAFILRRFKLSIAFLPLIIFTPTFVLLSNNVLRQYIALPFLLAFILSLSRGKITLSTLSGALAILAHNSSIFLIVIAVFSSKKYKANKNTALLLIATLIALIAISNQWPLISRYIERSAEAVDDSIAKNIGYILYYFTALAGIAFAFQRQKQSRHEDLFGMHFRHALGLLATSGLMAELLLLFLPVFMINRILISLTCILLILWTAHLRLLKLRTQAGSVVFIATFSAGALLLHDGAKSMLFP